MGNFLTSYNQKDILKEMQVEKLINLDIAIDDKQYNPQVLKHKNRVLKYQLKTLQQEQEVVNWYISTMEDGISAEKVMKQYHDLKEVHKKLDREFEAYKLKSESSMIEKDKKIKDMRKYLSKQ